MEYQCGLETISDPASKSDAKLTELKRSGTEFGERPEDDRKRVKMRDLESLFRSEGIDTHYPKSLKNNEANDKCCSGEEEMSQVTEVPIKVASDAAQLEATGTNTLPLLVDHAPEQLDLNTKVCVASNLASDGDPPCAEDLNKHSLLGKNSRDAEVNYVPSRTIGLDLNVEDVSSSVNHDPFYPYKNHEHLKSRDVSECASSTGSLEEKDPLRVWKEMKQNGFLSSSYGGIPVPKQRGRKSKNDVLKKKMEIAKREQVDRFTKIAAPSGLLNELNPGIINHVRNSKQVHSIIEALVRSERRDNGHVGSKQTSQLKSGGKELSDGKKELHNKSEMGANRPSLPDEDGPHDNLPGSRLTKGNPMSINRSVFLNSEEKGGDADSSMVDKRVCGRASCVSSSTPDGEDDILALKLSSSTAKGLTHENASLLTNEQSITNVSSLSIKAATVASQWLELLQQDIKGRLAALRRSKKRVQAVIITELPFLLSKEFSSNQENDSCAAKNSAAGFSNNAVADMHGARWSALFDQMAKALSEEEKQLESWSNQVREMQLHCERGLQLAQDTQPWLPLLGASETEPRFERVDKSDRELAVRAAAASIYSTCNFLLSMENVSCF